VQERSFKREGYVLRKGPGWVQKSYKLAIATQQRCKKSEKKPADLKIRVSNQKNQRNSFKVIWGEVYGCKK